MTFQIYNKKLGFWVGESDFPTQDSDFGNTEVPLPGEVGQGITYVFDESIQMWRSYTAKQWETYLNEKVVGLPTPYDDFQISVGKQLLNLSKTVINLTNQLASTTHSVTELQTQVKELQTQLKQLTEVQQPAEAKEEAQHV
ncbi:hypothetical protein LIX87_00035 [Weissella viridescens]|uniref:hypothetical protein n=1 Tax=Weissella viridescens TaxID=1629 RepID=UPI001D0906CE|nr:hypothetical protein [Weissella viridescens]MCB6839404.1 hypothetical protein [Weissella viridescens]MCB6846135.1 hypothetical protein [Weissella viridescens]